MRRFLIITQVFPPDPAAVGQYFDEAARALAGRGAQVTVLTANRGYDDPETRFAPRERRDGIEIRRLPLSSFGKASIPLRIFAQLSFLIQCILRGLFTPKLTDLLVSTSPPMAAITAVVIGLFRPRLRVHYWVMDLNPDQAVALGAFRPGHPLVRALDWLNRRILRRADTVIALDRFMADRLRAKLPPPASGPSAEADAEKITVLPPWPMDPHLEAVDHADNPFRKAQGWTDRFVVMYSGNHSLVHPLDTLLDAAERLRDDPRFVFAFIGGGKGKALVDQKIAERAARSGAPPKPEAPGTGAAPPSIVSLPYQPLHTIRHSLSAADLHVVSLGEDMSGIVHPCKVYGALAIGRPVLALGPERSYLRDILDRHAVGWAVRHGEVEACVDALRRAADLSAGERATLDRRAQEAADQSFSRKALLNRFVETVWGGEGCLSRRIGEEPEGKMRDF